MSESDLETPGGALAEAPEDYMIYIHLRDRDGQVRAAWDGPVARSDDGQRYYSTLVWEPGEFIVDERTLRPSADELPPPGDGYQIVIGFYNVVTNERVPLTVDEFDRISTGVGWGPTLLATAVSFVVALAAVSWLLRYIARHTYSVFIVYRVGLGVLVLALLSAGVLSPT